MNIARRNWLTLAVDRWIIVFLAIAVCAGCQNQISQLQLDPVVGETNQTVAAVKPTVDKTGLGIVVPETKPASDVISTTPKQTADQKLESKPAQPKPAQTKPALTANASQQQALIEDVEKKPQSKPVSATEPKTRIVAKKPGVLERNGKVYQPYHLNKNQTLLLLAAQPDIRSRILASTVREVTTPEQQLAAEQLAATFDQQYVEILRQRAAILENAIDGNGTEAKLLELRMTTADLNARIRIKINEEILTQDQRYELQRNFEESQK